MESCHCAANAPLMMRSVSIGVLFCLAACQRQAPGEPASFSVRARYVPAVQTAVITVTNRSQDYLCVATADHFLDSGLIKVLPASKNDNFENRPPPELIGDFDVSAGVEVVQPRGSRDLSLDLTELEGRQPKATSVRGKIRAASCKELFSTTRPRALEQSFALNLSGS